MGRARGAHSLGTGGSYPGGGRGRARPVPRGPPPLPGGSPGGSSFARGLALVLRPVSPHRPLGVHAGLAGAERASVMLAGARGGVFRLARGGGGVRRSRSGRADGRPRTARSASGGGGLVSAASIAVAAPRGGASDRGSPRRPGPPSSPSAAKRFLPPVRLAADALRGRRRFSSRLLPRALPAPWSGDNPGGGRTPPATSGA